MAYAVTSVPHLLDLQHLNQCHVAEGEKYLAWVSDFVSTNRHKSIKLKNPPGAILRIAELADTIYKDKRDEVKGWGKFYLPNVVHMQVLGIVEGTSCPSEQLVLMTCENKKLYAYDGEMEELHVVASGMDKLNDKGIEYPGSKTYYNGEAFKDMDEEDWEQVKHGDVGKTLEKEHQNRVRASKNAILESL